MRYYNQVKFLLSLLDLDEDTAPVIKKFYNQKVKNSIPKINEKTYLMTDDEDDDNIDISDTPFFVNSCMNMEEFFSEGFL